MGRTLYVPNDDGGISFRSERRPGEVRVPNYVYDIWMPLIGAEALGVYSIYCRLEMDGGVRKMTQLDIATACRIGKTKLAEINAMLVKCDFIKINKPKGVQKVMHWTQEIVVYDPPKEISGNLITEFQHPQGYKPLTPWLVQKEDSANVPPSTSERTNQYADKDPSGTPYIATLDLQPLNIVDNSFSSKNDEKGDTQNRVKSITDSLCDSSSALSSENALGVPAEITLVIPSGMLLDLPPATPPHPTKRGSAVAFPASMVKLPPKTERDALDFLAVGGLTKKDVGQAGFEYIQKRLKQLLGITDNGKPSEFKTYTMEQIIGCAKELINCGADAWHIDRVGNCIDKYLDPNAEFPPDWSHPKKLRKTAKEIERNERDRQMMLEAEATKPWLSMIQ